MLCKIFLPSQKSLYSIYGGGIRILSKFFIFAFIRINFTRISIHFHIFVAEANAQGNINDRLLNRLYVLQDLIELVQNETMQIGEV